MSKVKDFYKVSQGVQPGELGDMLKSVVNKSWVMMILANRASSRMDKSLHNPTLVDPATTKVTLDTIRKRQHNSNEGLKNMKSATNKPSQTGRQQQPTKYRNLIRIINVNTHPPTVLILQGTPQQLEINPETTWASVKSMGRNNPFMVYTGGEDIVSFDITWHSVQEDREDVINKCRLLESWCKADGYKSSPPILHILWGSSGIFDGHEFVLTAAPYKLANFQNSYLKGKEVVNLKLLPNSATQSLTLKRVTKENLKSEQIIPIAKQKATKGIELNNNG